MVVSVRDLPHPRHVVPDAPEPLTTDGASTQMVRAHVPLGAPQEETAKQPCTSGADGIPGNPCGENQLTSVLCSGSPVANRSARGKSGWLHRPQVCPRMGFSTGASRGLRPRSGVPLLELRISGPVIPGPDAWTAHKSNFLFKFLASTSCRGACRTLRPGDGWKPPCQHTRGPSVGHALSTTTRYPRVARPGGPVHMTGSLRVRLVHKSGASTSVRQITKRQAATVDGNGPAPQRQNGIWGDSGPRRPGGKGETTSPTHTWEDTDLGEPSANTPLEGHSLKAIKTLTIQIRFCNLISRIKTINSWEETELGHTCGRSDRGERLFQVVIQWVELTVRGFPGARVGKKLGHA